LAEATAAGRVAPPRRRLPGALARAVLRGLRPRPDERHRSMADLATALERIAARRPARWIAAAAAMAAAAGLTFALGRGSAADASADAAARQAGQAQLAGAWDAARRDELVAALTATGRPYAAAAARAAAAALDRYAGGWVA